MADEFAHAEVPRSLPRVQLLLCVEVLKPYMVSIDFHLNIYYPVSLFPEAVHNMKEFFIMDWRVELCGGEGIFMVLYRTKVFAPVNDMVLRQDTSNSLIASIGFQDCRTGSIELGNDES